MAFIVINSETFLTQEARDLLEENGCQVDDIYLREMSDDPLLGLDNVIATPWIGAFTEQAQAAMCIMAARNVIALLRGEEPEHLVAP